MLPCLVKLGCFLTLAKLSIHRLVNGKQPYALTDGLAYPITVCCSINWWSYYCFGGLCFTKNIL
jgi:hypothetical protein